MAGGPNSGMQDPWVQGSGWKKGEIPPQKCYLDNIEAWSVNECTINWNASLAWLTGFIAQENGGIEIGSTGSASGISNDGGDTEKSTKSDKTQNNKTNKSTSKKNDTDKNSESGESKGNVTTVAIIAGAVVAGLISLELFVYKLVKLKK